MSTLHQRIGVARRRLNWERFLGYLFRSWCAWLGVALVAIVVSKLWPMGVPAKTWTIAWLGGSLAAGFITAWAGSYLTRNSELDAAIEIDKRFGLKERISSAIVLDSETLKTAAGQALLTDTVRRIERLDVGRRFPIGIDRSAWWPLVPGTMAVLVALLISSRVPENPAVATTSQVSRQIKKSAQALQKKLEQNRAEAKKHGLHEADSLLKKLEEGTRELSNKAAADQQKAMIKLNDLSKELEQRRQKLAYNEKFKQQLNNLKDLKKGPAEAAAQAMKNGDFRKAMKEIEDLKKKMADGKLDENEKKQLAEQLRQMQDVLQKAVEAHEEAKQEIEKQIEKARQSGDTQRAQKLQQQLDQMQQQKPAMQKLQQLAQQCKECANAMQQGNAQQARQALDKLGEELNAMAQSQEEMKMLQEALDEIAEAKKGMAGDGDKDGPEGDLDGEMAMQAGGKNQKGPPGRGMGEGRGKGERPEERNKTGFYDSKVSQNVGKGAAVLTDLVDGPNKKGEVTESIKSAFENARQGGDDPLAGQRLPRGYRDHAKEYFDAFREGK